MDGVEKTILLAGATGYIGQVVAQKLLETGHRVIAPVRDVSHAPPDCTAVQVDLMQADALDDALCDLRVDAVISCVASRSGAPDDAWAVDCQINRHLLAAGKKAGAEQFVLLSAICVQRPKLAFQHAKLAFEKELSASGLAYSIVRPTAFFKSLSGQIARVQAGKSFLLFGDGRQTACKPIAESDLADFMVKCLSDPALRNQILPIGGPGAAITSREQGELLFELTGQPPKFRQVPVAMFNVAIGLLAPLSKVFPQLAAKAEFARIGRYYATESMLLWDEQRGAYDAAATPSFGTVTLREHYENVLRDGIDGHEAGEHKLF